jgi:hypothetical protein
VNDIRYRQGWAEVRLRRPHKVRTWLLFVLAISLWATVFVLALNLST